MWEAPNHDPAASSGGGDALSGPPDSARPANPWPRLLAFGATVLISIFLLGLCVVSFANPPKRELRMDITELAIGMPKFFPVTTFGADADGNTYGAWVTLQPGGTVAVLSLGPSSRCNLKWEPTATAGGQTGAFVDRCGPSRFDAAGAALEGTPARGLDMFSTRRAGTVDLRRCNAGHTRHVPRSGHTAVLTPRASRGA